MTSSLVCTQSVMGFAGSWKDAVGGFAVVCSEKGVDNGADLKGLTNNTNTSWKLDWLDG